MSDDRRLAASLRRDAAIRKALRWGVIATLVIFAACSQSPGKANTSPVLDHIGPKSVAVGHLLTIALSGSDADGDTLVFSTGSLPTGATFDASLRTFDWTPTATDVGNVDVVFQVSDGKVTMSETVTITVMVSSLWDAMVWDSDVWN